MEQCCLAGVEALQYKMTAFIFATCPRYINHVWLGMIFANELNC